MGWVSMAEISPSPHRWREAAAQVPFWWATCNLWHVLSVCWCFSQLWLKMLHPLVTFLKGHFEKCGCRDSGTQITQPCCDYQLCISPCKWIWSIIFPCYAPVFKLLLVFNRKGLFGTAQRPAAHASLTLALALHVQLCTCKTNVQALAGAC